MALEFALPFRDFFSMCKIDIPPRFARSYGSNPMPLSIVQATCMDKKLETLYNSNLNLSPVNYNDNPEFGWYLFIDVTQAEFTVGDFRSIRNQPNSYQLTQNNTPFKKWTMPTVSSHLGIADKPMLVYITPTYTTNIQINFANSWTHSRTQVGATHASTDDYLFVNTWQDSSLHEISFNNPDLGYCDERGWYIEGDDCPCYDCGKDVESIYAIYYLGTNLHPSTRVINHPGGL